MGARATGGVLGFVESPAQLLNAVEWAYAEETAGRHARADVRLVVLGPAHATTRLQLHRVSELAAADGFSVDWAEVRLGRGPAARVLPQLAHRVKSATTILVADPYSGIIHTLLNVARSPRMVVVDDGTATIRYAEQWAGGAELRRWHEGDRSRSAKLVGRRAAELLGRRSPAVQLFTAMPIAHDIPQAPNEYLWTRSRFGPPEVLAGTDLMGSSLVETGVVAEAPYLAGVERLITERGVARYLPHRAELPAKLRAIEALGVTLVRPDLPMEIHARRGPIGSHLLSFPSTVLHTLPLVLADVGVPVESLSIQDSWFTRDSADDAVDFVRGI